MKILFSILAVSFSICIFWAANLKPISESGAWLMSDPWGIVTLADLYIGFLLFSIFMFLTAPKKKLLIVWVPALMILGNVIALVYLIFYNNKLNRIFGVENESD